MEETASRAHLKRPLSVSDDDEPNKPPMPKRVRFPKGKKLKVGDASVSKDEVASVSKDEEVPSERKDARFAAKERAKRRSQITAELFHEEGSRGFTDVSAAEVHYEDDADFDDDGIQIEPFNLENEREEGYFDADGNFVEYVNEKETKDAWLDSVDSIEVDTKFASKRSEITNNEEDNLDLSTEDIGKIKRRIADLLESGETVLQALRRLKGTSTDKKGRMSEEIKLMFDQLTEDAMNLLENDVYHEKKEVFEREAEGYERVARAREGTSISAGYDNSDYITRKDMFSNGLDSERATSQLPETASGPTNLNLSTAQVSSSNAADSFDMFAENEENGSSNLSADVNGLGSGCVPEPFSQPASGSVDHDPESGGLQTDYMYDESSGYYYSSSLGYYYDPTSGLYCCATSGRWYSYNEQNGTYDEIRNETTSI